MMTWVAYTYGALNRSFSLRRLTYDVNEEISGGNVELELAPGAELAEEERVERSVVVPDGALADPPLFGYARCRGMCFT